MGIILNLVARILIYILSPIAYVYGFFETSTKDFDRFNYQIAYAKDCCANVQMQYLFSALFITKIGYHFGNINESISSVLGKNERDGTLTNVGKLLVYILDFFDKNHCQKSIDNNIL